MKRSADLLHYCSSLPGEFPRIPDKRKALLQQVSEYIRNKHREGRPASLIVICTHNSRRSHLGQVWLQTAANYYHLEKIRTYSGGTETTAFHPNAVACLRRAGFFVEMTKEDANPVYHLSTSEDLSGWSAYSKRYDDDANPVDNFCAIMVCTDADQNCPVVLGADQRIALPYQDPKSYDNTPQEGQQYDRSCRHIAREMFYAMSILTNRD